MRSNIVTSLFLALAGQIATAQGTINSDFVEACIGPESIRQHASYREMLNMPDTAPINVGLGLFKYVFDGVALTICRCFETTYSDLSAPVNFEDLWQMLVFLQEGELEMAQQIMLPLSESPDETKLEYQSQIDALAIEFELCVKKH